MTTQRRRGRAPRPGPRALLALLCIATAGLSGCASAPSRSASVSTSDLRVAATASTDGELVGRWALSELVAPGGDAAQAAKAIARLDGMPQPGMWASLARALFDDEHGNPRSAAGAYVLAMTAAAASPEPVAPLVAWFCARHLLALRGPVTDLFAQHRPALEALLSRPGHAGWRAVADLEEWRAAEIYDRAERTSAAYDQEVVERLGCARAVRIAGPFGHGVERDALASFAAEQAAPWPSAWPADPVRRSVPRILTVVQHRCLSVAQEQVEEGVFYVETFFTTQGDREIIVAVQGALDLWIDGAQVLHRGPQEWGSWQRFGAHVSVGDGRHRVLAKTVTAAASVRLLNPDGTAAGIAADDDPRAGFTALPPVVLDDPNPIDHDVLRLAASEPTGLHSPIDVMLAAYAAHVDQMDDVACALIEPLVTVAAAAPVALELASAFAASDPAWPEDARGPRSRALRDRALARDPHLWRASLQAILDEAQQHGLSDAIDPLRKLSTDVPSEPEVLESLAQLYARLGWRGEQLRALQDLAARFPDDLGALRAVLEALDEEGPPAEADRVASRIARLDPDADVDLDRALSRRDYAMATKELKRLGARRPDRKDIANRMADVLARSGDPRAATEQLEKALAKHPRDAEARFRLADRAYANGETTALRKALAAAIEAGAPSHELRAAIDLVEGATNLEPYREDGLAVIRAFQAWEAAGHHMDGTAARVLDYSAIWVHDDGSSEMLEHEIQRQATLTRSRLAGSSTSSNGFTAAMGSPRFWSPTILSWPRAAPGPCGLKRQADSVGCPAAGAS